MKNFIQSFHHGKQINQIEIKQKRTNNYNLNYDLAINIICNITSHHLSLINNGFFSFLFLSKEFIEQSIGESSKSYRSSALYSTMPITKIRFGRIGIIEATDRMCGKVRRFHSIKYS